MSTKRLIIILAISVFSILLINHMITSSLNKDEEKNKVIQQEQIEKNLKNKKTNSQPATAKIERKRELVPEDPAKYGIVSIPQSSMPKTQMHWDFQMEKLISDSQVLESDEGKEAVKKMKINKEQFREKMSRVDEEIARFEEKKKESPFDSEVDNRLQTLYKLKSLSKVLDEKVTSQRVR